MAEAVNDALIEENVVGGHEVGDELLRACLRGGGRHHLRDLDAEHLD